ncbi:hypothetical protein KDK95_23080 [Actinospica sp. MGRD01-02]|uniref:Uncharacterized protein n=1 Tax=Actinospica acidithermotolerans TaxID=2828514 RepID=A0A941EEU5_9ACTN|nr:hypothetical protein [Actinospica acidithermotolerans]MBR7829210.1 hypothetical protein [Actinospica acidithermotolerans]
MALEPEDAIPQEYLPEQPEPAARIEEGTAPAKEMSDAAFLGVVGVPWIAGAAWIEWNNFPSWWVSSLLLTGFGLAASGFSRGKYADVPRLSSLFVGVGVYIYGLVVADTVSLRVWLGLWLLVAFLIFGAGLPKTETPDPQQEPRDRGPSES